MRIRLSYLRGFRKLTKRPPDGVVHLYFSLSGFLTYLPVKTLIILVYDIQNDNYYIIMEGGNMEGGKRIQFIGFGMCKGVGREKVKGTFPLKVEEYLEVATWSKMT